MANDEHEEFHKQLTKIHGDRWKNRRKMAWLSLIAGILFPILAIWVTDPNIFVSLSGPFYIFVGAVVSCYIGFSTMDDIKCQEHLDDDD